MNRIRLFVKSLAGTLVFLAILFVSAGRINYWQGWLYASISFVLVILNSFAPGVNDDLAEERASTRSGTKSWDKLIIGFSAIVLVITYVVAGLDAGRFRCSPQIPWIVTAMGMVFILFGEVAFLAAQKQNRFFSSVMRIQTDRRHAVCDTGVYRIVRHPAYLGMIVTAAGIPLVLGSLWSLIPAFFSILLTVIRTSLEDRTLIAELEGYREYTHRTRYRLIPYIW